MCRTSDGVTGMCRTSDGVVTGMCMHVQDI